MNSAEVEGLLKAVAGRRVPARAAIKQLETEGFSSEGAYDLVFHALGGSESVEMGEDAVKRYQPSGRTISEITKEMES